MMLVAENLRFSYPGKDALISDVSLRIVPGSVVGLLGPNGAGKTTLLRLLTGELRPTSGKVLLCDRPIREYPPRDLARRLALVPQSPSPMPGFTALDAVLLGRYAHLGRFQREGEEDLKIAQEAMEKTGTWELRGHLTETLSGGEWQRIAIARALAQKPGVLLLDEPTSNLDIRHQLETLRLLRELSREGMAVGVVMHDIALAARSLDQIALLRGGRLYAQGSPDQVLTPESLFDVYGVRARVFGGARPRFEFEE